ncbi:hypothetical protein [Corynebacterium gerontici]|uniref:Uncharacterized protein n=1 Tax=Corynebacterium gerontici TaxID=2079234 RepID=A0A3G6J205_9CORY|nr:hypothetical protein [Corynebacterium gerontici]AZA10410.1 hypothetical protein CGERO_00360 [Corynebacterium gerontici]
MSKRRIIATVAFVLGMLVAGWLWMQGHHLAAAGVLLIPAAWNLFSSVPSSKEIKELEQLRHRENPTLDEVKRYREAHPGSSITEAIAALKRQQKPPQH